MAFGAKEIILYIRKTSYIFVHDHPFAIGMVFFVLMLYRFFPSLFVFLVSSSPVIVCAALLLGIILIYGEPNIPEVEEEDRKTQRLSPPMVGALGNVEGRRETMEMAVREDALGDRRASVGSKAVAQDERYGRGDSSMAASSLVNKDKKQNYGKKVSEDKKICGNGIAKKKKSSSEKLAAGGAKVGTDIGGAITSNQEKARDVRKGVGRPNSDIGLDSSLGSPWHHVDHHDASSSSEPDQAESSSPDAASVSDIMPMLDELHPLLDSEAPQPALVSKDNTDDASVESSDDDSAEEEAENQDDEDDEEGQVEKDDVTKPVVTWTADDQQNLVELKKSELERNRRLEYVIANRRARKLMEKNLIDLDSNDLLPSIEELSHFQVQIPSVFAPRRNPFDLPYDANEIPASAPSRLMPRRNPFDLPSEQPDGTGSSMVENLSHQELVTNPQRDMLFRRHESFTSGALFLGDITQEQRMSRFKPYFVAERTDAEETGFADDQRESIEKSDLKVSSPKSDAASSATEQESHEDLPEQELHPESDSLAYHDAECGEQESQSSGEADSVDIEQVQSGINPSDDHSMVMEDTRQAAEALKVGEETNEELKQNAIVSFSEKAVVIDEKYESGSSTSSEGNEKSAEASIHEQAASLEQTFTADSDIHGREVERVDDSQVAEPVYDSSPSATEKTQSNVSALDEALFGAGKEGSNLHYSSIPDMQANVSLVGSPLRTSQKNASLGERTREELASAGEMFWIASSLASVEENESRSREISEIRERDVIGDELSGVRDDLVHPIVPILPKASSERQLHRSSLSSRRSSLLSRRSSLSSVESELSEELGKA